MDGIFPGAPGNVCRFWSTLGDGGGVVSPHGSIIKGDPNWRSPEALQKLVWSLVVVCPACPAVDNPCWLPSFSAQTRKPRLLPVLAPGTHWSWTLPTTLWSPSTSSTLPLGRGWVGGGVQSPTFPTCRATRTLTSNHMFHWAFELTEELNFFKWNEKPRSTIQICLWRFVLKNFQNSSATLMNTCCVHEVTCVRGKG